jgi:hypothetical protein
LKKSSRLGARALSLRNFEMLAKLSGLRASRDSGLTLVISRIQ